MAWPLTQRSREVFRGPYATDESAFGACCQCVTSPASSPAVAGCPSRRETVSRLLASVSGPVVSSLREDSSAAGLLLV
jgi:hypothetical protein